MDMLLLAYPGCRSSLVRLEARRWLALRRDQNVHDAAPRRAGFRSAWGQARVAWLVCGKDRATWHSTPYEPPDMRTMAC